MFRRVIIGVVVCLGMLAGVGAVRVRAADRQTVVIAFSQDYTLHYLVGQYDPDARTWLPNTVAFKPPPALTPFTLFGPSGKLAEVHTLFKALPYNPPWGWGADINRWSTNGHPQTLAVSGVWANPPRVFQPLPLDDADSAAAIIAYLKTKHLEVAHPRLTQNFRIDLNGDGTESQVICANFDPAVLIDSVSAPIYTVALLRHSVAGKPVDEVLRAATSYKPQGRTADDQQRLYGAFGFYQVLAVTDVEGTGHEQIATLNTVSTGPEVDMFMLDNDHLKHVLSMAATYY